jgi:hypothetical protein
MALWLGSAAPQSHFKSPKPTWLALALEIEREHSEGEFFRAAIANCSQLILFAGLSLFQVPNFHVL